jgi:HAD superfamily hydrolase (TIGR01509 family)
MAIRAVLFDFDGVLADTENHHVAAWQRTLAALGWSIPDEIAVRSAEIDDRAFLSELFWARGVTEGDVEGWLRKKQQLMVSLLKDSPRLYPGVVELVDALHGRVELAVVTGTSRQNVEVVLEAAGLAQSFSLIVSKEDVRQIKPDPEPYRFAVNRLGIAPDEAVALEDSPSGLSSARAAGVHTIAVGHRRSLGDWILDAPFVPALGQTSEILHRIGLGRAS